MIFRGIPFILLVVLVPGFSSLFHGRIASAQCQGDLQGLMQQCAQYVQRSGPKVAPSPSCCKVLQSVDLPCVCQHVNADVEQIISMEKSVFVASSCGKPLPHGSVCGSYTVP